MAYTPRGRAYNSASGSLGATANAAFLATTYGATETYSNGALAARYVCWARSQIRYMLGDADQSYVVGYGVRAPAHADNRAASCPPPPQQCNAVTGLLNPNANPNVLYGALVEGALFSDRFQDVRALNSTNVQIDYNPGFQACPTRPMLCDAWDVKAEEILASQNAALCDEAAKLPPSKCAWPGPKQIPCALQGALAGLSQASGSWEECLQGFGALSKDQVVCGS